ncbi:MAG: glycosyltransferase family 4 protein [Bacteroidetes bacterium]|nr:glycosyltransferase family 4 protein [Bacteroidota bacterium]
MKILILTQYFPPETGAAQNRLWNLAIRLQQKGAEVTVLTAMPNYPQMRIYDGYRGKFYVREQMDSLTVHRCWLYARTSKSIVPRLLNYFSFVKTSFLIGIWKSGRFDYIICESPPLFLGMSAWLLAKARGAKLIFNVSDLWPESAEKLGLISNRYLLRITTWLEEFLYRSSYIITGQTKGIVKNISQRFPEKTVHWLKNGIDPAVSEEVPADTTWRKDHGYAETDFLLIYAGILGHAQGLEVILKAAQLLKEKKNIRFVLAGAGPERDKLVKMKEDLRLDNVSFFDTMPRKELLGVISAIDAAIIPLRRIDLFKGAIPSKIFENLALKKPLLLGVEGEAKELFIDEGKTGIAFIPGDEHDLAEKAEFLSGHPELVKEYGENGCRYINANFNWDQIAEDLWNLIQPMKGEHESNA